MTLAEPTNLAVAPNGMMPEIWDFTWDDVVGAEAFEILDSTDTIVATILEPIGGNTYNITSMLPSGDYTIRSAAAYEMGVATDVSANTGGFSWDGVTASLLGGPAEPPATGRSFVSKQCFLTA